MRVESVSGAKDKPTSPRNKEPGVGTQVRVMYDFFKSHPGEPVEWSHNRSTSKKLSYLTDFYGLDIRNLGYRRWVLAGEWFGDKYVDYIAERIARS